MHAGGALTRERFEALFLAAMNDCRHLTSAFVAEELPEQLRFRLALNRSHDLTLQPGERVFPEDGSLERMRELVCVDAERAIDVLWRDGCVPEWADPGVISANGEYTLIQISCCGRFTDDEELLYLQPGGRLIFNVGVPERAGGFGVGGSVRRLRRRLERKSVPRLSVHRSTECWDEDELEQALAHREKIEILALVDFWVDDGVLERLPLFPSLRHLRLRGSTIAGTGFAGLERQPQLCTLRLGTRLELSFAPLAFLPNLTQLDVTAVALDSLGRLREMAPELNSLTLAVSAPDDLTLPRLDQVESLSVHLPHLPRQPLDLSWPALTSLSLKLSETTDAAVSDLFSRRPPRLESLHMRGCPIGDETLFAAAAIPTLEYLDVVDTNVSDAALEELRSARPDLRLRPTGWTKEVIAD